MFQFIFKCYKNFVGEDSCPVCVMSDGCGSIAAAVRDELPQAAHLLCIWHIVDKNVTSHFKNLLTAANLQELQHMLWSFALTDDTRSIETAEEEWLIIKTFVDAHVREKMKMKN